MALDGKFVRTVSVLSGTHQKISSMSGAELPSLRMDANARPAVSRRGASASWQIGNVVLGVDVLNARMYLEEKVLILIITLILFNPPFPMQRPR